MEPYCCRDMLSSLDKETFAYDLSAQWSCITGKGLAQDTTQPIATTQREVRALYSVGWGTPKRVGLSTFHSSPFYLI